MSDQNNINKFDEFFKSNFEEFEPNLPSEAWDNIDKRLPSKPGRKYVGFWILGLAGISSALLFNYTDIFNTGSTNVASVENHAVTTTVNGTELNPKAIDQNHTNSSLTNQQGTQATEADEKGTSPAGAENISTDPKQNTVSSAKPSIAAAVPSKLPLIKPAAPASKGKKPSGTGSSASGTDPIVTSGSSPEFVFPPASSSQSPALPTGGGVSPLPKRQPPFVKDAYFAFIDTIICAGEQARMMNLSNDRFNKFSWDFGDNTVSTEKSPKHAYTAEGTFTVVLKAIAGEEVKTFSRKIYVKKVKAFFTADIEAMPKCSFINLSVGADKYFWAFGDGYTTTDKNPEHSYNSMKSEHTVRLIATNTRGCADTFALKVVNNDLADKDKKPLMGNIFTPNGDGMNDRFEIRLSDEIYYHLVVVDMDGAKVFESFDKNDTWNGDRMGTGVPCQNGVYFYFFNYQVENKPPVKTRGSITLTREKY